MTDRKYDLVEEDYDNVDESFHNEYDSTKEFAKQITSYTNNLKSKDRLLNIGGTFVECQYFLEKKFDVSNLDISQKMLDYITKNEPRVKTIKSNALNFEVNGFSGVWACRSLIHIPPEDIDIVLGNIYESLEGGGIFGSIFFTSETADIVIDEKPEPHSNREDTTYYCVLYPRELIELKVKNAGFKTIRSEECIDQDGDKAIYIEAIK